MHKFLSDHASIIVERYNHLRTLQGLAEQRALDNDNVTDFIENVIGVFDEANDCTTLSNISSRNLSNITHSGNRYSTKILDLHLEAESTVHHYGDICQVIKELAAESK